MVSTQRAKLIKILVSRTLSDGGLTFDFKNNKFVEPKDFWYFPKYPGHTAIVDKEKLSESISKFIESHYNLLLERDTVFGTWVNPQSDKVYIDINAYKRDKAAALKLAKKVSHEQGRNIVSMYNPIQNKTVYIDH